MKMSFSLESVTLPLSWSLWKALLLLLATMVLTWILPAFIKRKAKLKLIERFPGPSAWPVLGNIRLKEQEPKEQFASLFGNIILWGKHRTPLRLWLGPRPTLFLSTAQAIEPIVTSTTEILKSYEYKFMRSILGDGLVTSTGSKWFTHRKLITPAFHFKVLEDFAVIMNENSQKLVRALETKADGQTINIYKFIKLCALDIICESAMGTSVNALQDENSEYVRALESLQFVMPLRQRKPWLAMDPIYKMTHYYKKEKHYVDITRSFIQRVVNERKNKMTNGEINFEKEEDNQDILGGRKKLAFLDLILSSITQKGASLTNEEIEDEVSTFMGAGHDTTTAGISWCLLLLGLNPDIQERCFEEIQTVVGSDEDISSSHLRRLKYLECCLKESQRLYPSVPMFARELQSDMDIDGFEVPAGVTVAVFTFGLHRDPTVWPDPDKFDPERFSEESLVNKHPYSYIPFSAGPRNCIGQKFAMLEEKIMVATILRHFKIQSVDRRDTIDMAGLVVLQPINGVHITLTSREL